MKQIKKFLSVLMACVIAFSTMVVSASAGSIFDTAKVVSSGETISDVFITQTGPWYDKNLDYKITIKESGTLNLSYSAGVRYFKLYLYDADGNEVINSSYKVNTGTVSLSGKNLTYKWNSATETIKGSASYKVSKGTYYIRAQAPWDCYNDGSRKFNMTVKTSSNSSSSIGKISYLQITVPKGTTLKLAAVISGSGTATWKSSKPSVATVSSKGLITAKSKGFTIVTCTLGSSKVKVRIKVS